MQNILEVSGLKVSYFANREIKAVEDVSFKILEGQSLGIAGESGSGKSTLGSAIIRSIPYPGRIIEGNIKYDGTEISKVSDKEFNERFRWKKISMIFQGALNSLDPVYTVGQQMREILVEHHFTGNILTTINEVLEQVLLEPKVSKSYPHELSGGMKQRVVIAMALLLKPRILIADEPTTSLDVIVQAQIINLLKKIKTAYNMSIIFISHDLSIISEIAEVIAIMYGGQLVEFGPAREVYLNPKHPYTQVLISSIPRLDKTKGELGLLNGRSPDMSKIKSGCRFADRCKFVKQICESDPPNIETEGGFVKCWLYK
jgi:peptide/nickel transport system ATP-binding protein